ncbi:MAG: DUF4349 domain-containing protein, partial [Deltaproteobacteria bacterium]|nr:DUF4349 domain-containing protein [Deltaproteobacteria bacterium]
MTRSLALCAAGALALVARPVPAADKKPPADKPAATEPAPLSEPEPAQISELQRATALTGRVVLKVVHPIEVRESLADAAKALGGFPMLVTDDQLIVKVPPGRLGEMMAKVAAEGLLLEKSMEREDLTESIAQLEGRARSKNEILARLRGFIDDSNVQATLQIERNMTDLVTEIEQVRGELRVAQERAKWAVVDV